MLLRAAGPSVRVSKTGRTRGSTAAKLAAEKKATAEKAKRQRQANDSFWKRTGSRNEETSTAEGSSAGARGSTMHESSVGVSNADEQVHCLFMSLFSGSISASFIICVVILSGMVDLVNKSLYIFPSIFRVYYPVRPLVL